MRARLGLFIRPQSYGQRAEATRIQELAGSFGEGQVNRMDRDTSGAANC